MNQAKNYVQLIGRLGQEPELITFDSGKSKISFSLATSDSYVNKEGEKVENTHWHNIMAWGKVAELMSQILKKGNQVLVQGKLEYRSYEDKKGETRYISEIVANSFMSLEKAPAAQAVADA